MLSAMAYGAASARQSAATGVGGAELLRPCPNSPQNGRHSEVAQKTKLDKLIYGLGLRVREGGEMGGGREGACFPQFPIALCRWQVYNTLLSPAGWKLLLTTRISQGSRGLLS